MAASLSLSIAIGAAVSLWGWELSTPLLGLPPLPQVLLALHPRPLSAIVGLVKRHKCFGCCVVVFLVWGLSSYGIAWLRASGRPDRPTTRARDDQEKKPVARTDPFYGVAHEIMCGHLFGVVCMQRGTTHGRSCDLARHGVRVARGGLCISCDQREKDRQRERRSVGLAYPMAPAPYVS